ncbi:GIY-YIG nuclease family protein [Lapidilactobacillus bayanensis]|uniref:GIY-YIG nuclease family protein n=1 Tax=Lapidilactobacillus bayanensis TaxID=2485998 RepID=UPI000F78FDE4|nr:GIY-YIG nuclease family protein [Lapidilactobacillus bayanensis]
MDLKEVKRMYYCYVVLCADGTLYTGSTNDVAKRVATHNAGKGAKYTKTRRPVKLLYQQEFASKHDALSFEAKFKRQTRMAKVIYLRAHGVAFAAINP